MEQGPLSPNTEPPPTAGQAQRAGQGPHKARRRRGRDGKGGERLLGHVPSPLGGSATPSIAAARDRRRPQCLPGAGSCRRPGSSGGRRGRSFRLGPSWGGPGAAPLLLPAPPRLVPLLPGSPRSAPAAGERSRGGAAFPGLRQGRGGVKLGSPKIHPQGDCWGRAGLASPQGCSLGAWVEGEEVWKRFGRGK